MFLRKKRPDTENWAEQELAREKSERIVKNVSNEVTKAYKVLADQNEMLKMHAEFGVTTKEATECIRQLGEFGFTIHPDGRFKLMHHDNRH